MGRVFDSPNGKAVEGAKIYVNGTLIGETKNDGSYWLEKINAGFYLFEIKSSKSYRCFMNLRLKRFYLGDYLFEKRTLRVSPSLKQLPDFSATAYSVCGIVSSDKPQLVQIKSASEVFTVSTEAPSGKFCKFLYPRKYEISVASSNTVL